MKKSFLLGEPDSIHVDIQRLIDTRLLIQANSGGGKSWCLRRILEQTHGAVQHLVIDPEGEFSSLRERFDYVLAAKTGGDTAADVRSARLLAERLLELGVSAILDIYELKSHERVSFVKEFLEALVNAPKRLWHPALVVVDEAHVFAPEQAKAESAGAVIDLATRGRKRGFCAVLATQRLSKLAKDAAAECNNKLIGRTGLDVDVKRAADELGFSKERQQEFRHLPEGGFFAYGPAISRQVVSVQVGGVSTSHPKAGARLAFSAPPATAKIKALLPKLADLPAESEQRKRTEDEMRREISTLKRELAAKPKPVEAKTVEPKRVEVQVLGDKQIDRLQKTFGAMREDLDRYESRIAGRFGAVTKALADVAAALAKVGRNGHGEVTQHSGINRRIGSSLPRLASPPMVPPRQRLAPKEHDGEKLSGAEQRILDALAELEALGVTSSERVQVAFLAGYGHLNSKGFVNAVGALNTAGRIRYPVPGRVELTEAGRALANFSGDPRTPEELQTRVLELLGGVHGRILQPLIDAYPGALPRDVVAERAGYAHLNSKGFVNAIGRLRSLRFIDYPSPGQVVACPVLFLEEG